MYQLSKAKHRELVKLRQMGRSIPEISKETGVAKTTVQRHIKEVQIPDDFRLLLKEKQGGAKDRAKALRENTVIKAEKILGKLSPRDRLMLLIGIYWGEGTKKDFAIINSDPLLLQTFLRCLQELEIPKSRLSFALRVHSNIPILEAKSFWSKATGLPGNNIGRIEVIEGKKKGKLPYGMCRIRVRSGIRDRLLIQTMISLIGKDCSKELLSR